MKTLIILALALSLSGCAGEGGGNSNLDLPFIGDISTESTGKGRFDAWALVEGKKGATIKEIEETKQKEIDLEIAKANQVRVNLDTPEKINAWNNAQATRDLGEVAKNLSKGQAPNQYVEYFRPTPMPKSAFAEGAEVVLDGAAKLAGTPAAQITSVGYAAGQFVGGMQQGQRVTATDNAQVTINQASAKGQSTANAGNSQGSTGKTDQTKAITADQYNQCTTCSGGRVCAIEEVNACFIRDYGHSTEIRDGKIWLGDTQVWPR